tara:strand:- start:491 stop:622 length:132 start_codon:yes stop_codon:yes gene_type:complete
MGFVTANMEYLYFQFKLYANNSDNDQKSLGFVGFAEPQFSFGG